MNSICFEIGNLPVHWYGVMMALGFLAGLANWAVQGRREGRDFNFCSDLLFWIIVSGILGARLAYVLHELPHYIEHPADILQIQKGGLIYYGGFIASGAALWVFARRHGLSFTVLVDFVMTSVPLAHAFGRVGCFLNGCCYGHTTDMPWGVRFPAESAVWWDHVTAGRILRFTSHSLPVHPVQLYEALFNLFLYGLMFLHYRNRRTNGSTTALYLLTYPTGRFLMEFLRGDDRLAWFGVSISQAISMVLFAVGLCIAWWVWKRGRQARAVGSTCVEGPFQ